MAAPLRLTLTRTPSLGPQPLSRKDAALLAVLALDGSCARDTLALMLWPGVDTARARASLRQRRFRLARAAGGAVLDGDETLRLAEGVAHPAAQADRLLQADPTALDGDLLDGLDFADCPEIDHWLQQARERWRVLRAQALARLASQLEDAAQLAAALAVAQRLAADEPLSDHATRRLMRLHHRRGDLGSAIEAYRRLARRLESELGERPDDETAALAASLRQDVAPAPRAVPPTLARPPRRIGRDAAWAALQQALAGAGTLIVEGAPGVGKSRLLGDFVAALSGPGLHVAALAGDAARPYALLARLLSRLWLAPHALRPGGADALPAWARRELAVLLPELGDAVRQADALRMQRAAALALHGAGLRLIALDDVQQADAATLELLPALAGERSMCWLLGLRTGEAPPAVQAWLQASDPPSQLQISALDRHQVAELLNDLALPGIAGADWADAIARHTGGLPLFVLETLRSLHAMPTPALDALDALAPPAAAAQSVRSRASRLPERARQLAHAAAVLAAPLPLQAGAALLGGRSAALADWAEAFGALESAQWLDAQGRMHDLVAAALRDAMPAAERRWLHSRVADWLGTDGADPLAAAGHWEAAAMPARAAPLLEDAARRAGRAGRPAEQLALWDRAMACWAQAGRADRRFAVWRESAEARLFVAGPTRLRPQAQALLDEAQDEAQQLDALTVLAETCLVGVDLAAAETAAARALTLAGRLALPALRLRAACSLAASQAQQGRVGPALATLDAQADALTALPRADQQAWLSTRCYLLHRADRLVECAQSLAEVIRFAAATDDGPELCTTLANRSILLSSLGRYPEARADADHAAEVLARLGDSGGVHGGNVHLALGYALTGLGALAAAAAAVTRAAQAFAAVGEPWVAIAANAQASVHLLADEVDVADAVLGAPPQAPAFVAARHHLLRSRIAARRGDDPTPALTRGHAALLAAPDATAALQLDGEAARRLPPAQRSASLARLARRAGRLQQFALASRLRWYRVQALLETGRVAAAARACDALQSRHAAPSDWLPADCVALAAEVRRRALPAKPTALPAATRTAGTR